MNKRNIKISLVLNIIIVLLTIFSFFLMFTGLKIMSGEEVLVTSSRIGLFKFFTVDSNLFMGITALIFMIEEINVLRNGKKEINTFLYVLKLAATSAVTLTLLVVFLYLGPVSGNLKMMLMNSNLFMHLITPLVSIITFALFERTIKIKFKYTLYGVLPTILYSFFYVTNILVHMENGKVSPVYDFYWFVQNGVKTAFIVVPVMILFSYIICICLWFMNKKRNLNK